MNCRINEEKVFPSPKVSSVLEEYFIEARLHTDGQENIERIRQLQKELAKSVATPFYVIIDPVTGREIGETLGGVTSTDSFREFLLDGIAARERVGRLDEPSR